MNNPRQTAGKAAFLSWLSSELRTTTAEVRSMLEPLIEPGERIRAELPDGTVIGAVTIGKAAESASVTDERALLAWVKEHAPTEVVESVNAAYVQRLKDQAKKHGYAYDEATGEVIPGIELRTGSPSYRPTVDAGAKPLLRARLAEIVQAGLLELPHADGQAEAS